MCVESSRREVKSGLEDLKQRQRELVEGTLLTVPENVGAFSNAPACAHAVTATHQRELWQPDNLTDYNLHPTTTVGPFEEHVEGKLLKIFGGSARRAEKLR